MRKGGAEGLTALEVRFLFNKTFQKAAVIASTESESSPELTSLSVSVDESVLSSEVWAEAEMKPPFTFVFLLLTHRHILIQGIFLLKRT